MEGDGHHLDFTDHYDEHDHDDVDDDDGKIVPGLARGPAGSNCQEGRNSGTDTTSPL